MNFTRVTLGLALSLWLLGCATSPPVQEMSDARQAIAAAEEADADRLAPQTIGEARDYLAQAEEQIRDRNYGLARGSAMRARTRAIYALQASQAAQEAEDPQETTNN
jgi:F0F1-type ATP synthase membrane subunit b/b'